MDKPLNKDLNVPWTAVDCFCGNAPVCEMCDKFGWYYRNTDTGQTVSEMMRDALDRHG
jgi:hypothetical protein